MDRDTRAAYDAVASEYEARFLDELDEKPRHRELLEGFARATSDPVVEIGCGPGQVGRHVRRLVADLRALPFASASVGGALLYSLIHVARDEVVLAMEGCRRVLRRGGLALVSAHEGVGEVPVEEFLGKPVRLVGTYFTLDELVSYARDAGFSVLNAERRLPYGNEGATTSLYLLLEA
jgi:SAM-dependent methyltransferase